MPEARIGIVGGSGLYTMGGVTKAESVDVDTPFGKTSDSIILGLLGGERVAFLPRHGRHHHINPTGLPARANIYALKILGVERIISVSAVGSLKEELRPLNLVVPDQVIDRTRQRVNTFFEDNLVAHIAFAHPFCMELSSLLHQAGLDSGATTHLGGTYVVMEGPAFSTIAESRMYRSWGADIIGMTALPEAKLAREAEICYATLACVTDYDCWREGEEAVTVEMVVATLKKNIATSQDVLSRLIPKIPTDRKCSCGSALKDAILTPHDQIPPEQKKKLSPFLSKYVS